MFRSLGARDHRGPPLPELQRTNSDGRKLILPETMTKDTVFRTYCGFLERLTDQMLDVIEEEFGGGLLGSVARAGVSKMTGRIQNEMETQGHIVVEYAAAVARGNDGNKFERQFLATNPVYQRYGGDDADQLEEHLLSHFRQLGRDLSPIVASDRDDFWLAMRDEYSQEEAESLVDRHFRQAEIFKQYKKGVFPSMKLADRVITVIDEGERRLRDELYTELDRVYDGS